MFFFFQAEDGIRDLVRSRGLGDVYKRQPYTTSGTYTASGFTNAAGCDSTATVVLMINYSSSSSTNVTACDTYTWNGTPYTCLLYTSDAADERSSVDLGGRRIIKKKNTREPSRSRTP